MSDRARTAGTSRPDSARRVLVVEDCPDAAESLARLLSLWGFDALVAGDGGGALELLGWYRPGVVLLDLTLPDMDGLEVARRLRREDGPTRPLVVGLSGWAGEDDRRRCLEAGCDLHVVKPTDPEILRRLLASRAGEVETAGETDHEARR